MLVENGSGDAAPLIQKLFDEADPQFWDRVKKAQSATADEAPQTAAAA